jgi:hypothetical protein
MVWMSTLNALLLLFLATAFTVRGIRGLRGKTLWSPGMRTRSGHLRPTSTKPVRGAMDLLIAGGLLAAAIYMVWP